MDKSKLRACKVEIIVGSPFSTQRNQCGNSKLETKEYKGYFHTWGSEAYVTNGFLVGTTAGQISTTYGVVEYEDGTVHKVPPECITFTDREVVENG